MRVEENSEEGERRRNKKVGRREIGYKRKEKRKDLRNKERQ